MRNNAILSPDPTQFPDPKKALAASSAKEIYKNLLDMSLAYSWKKDDDGGRAALVFEPRFHEGAIDAYSGEITNEVNSWIFQKPQHFSIKPQGIQLVVKSRKEAETLLSKEFGVSLRGLRYVRDSSDDDDEERQTIQYYWKSSSKSKKRVYVSLLVERETGRVVDYNYSDGISVPKQKVSLQDAQQKALDTLTRYVDKGNHEILLTYSRSPFEEKDYPDWIKPKDDHLRYDPQFNKYFFRFNDLYQGIEVGFSTYIIDINPETGNISSLSFENDNFKDLPKPDGMITADQAAEIYENANPLQLNYVWPTYFDQVRPSPILLYVPEDNDISWIDPFTGKPEKND